MHEYVGGACVRVCQDGEHNVACPYYLCHLIPHGVEMFHHASIIHQISSGN